MYDKFFENIPQIGTLYFEKELFSFENISIVFVCVDMCNNRYLCVWTVRDKAYFKRLLSALGSGAVLFLAYLDGQPIAGTIGIYYGGKAWYLYGASSNQHRDAMPNYLLQWEMIRRALRQGCSVYDFRGVPGKVSKDHPLYGLYRFKKGFSGDYLKFTGLFTYKYKRLMSAVFLALLKIRRGRQGRRS